MPSPSTGASPCSTRTRRRRRPPGPAASSPSRRRTARSACSAPAVPRLVHLHRGPQGQGAAPPRGRQAPHGQRARPLRHRLRALHVLRHLRRGVPVRRPVLEPGVRVLRAPHRRPAPRQGPARRVDGDRPRLRGLRGRRPRPKVRKVPRSMVAQNIVFGVIAGRDRVRALRVVTTKNVVHAALYLVVVLAGVGANFLLLGAEFVAVTQVLVYIGAIVVLFLFGIMLTRAPDRRRRRPRQRPALVRRPGRRRARSLGVLGYAARSTRSATTSSPDEHRADHRRGERLDLRDRTSSRSRSCPSCCSPPSSAPSSWPGRTERDAPQPVPPPRRRPVLHRRLRRARPPERRARADVDRADPQRRQHQPGRLRRLARHRRRPGVRPVRHRHRRRRGRRRPGHRPAHLPQPPEHRPRRGRRR